MQRLCRASPAGAAAAAAAAAAARLHCCCPSSTSATARVTASSSLLHRRLQYSSQHPHNNIRMMLTAANSSSVRMCATMYQTMPRTLAVSVTLGGMRAIREEASSPSLLHDVGATCSEFGGLTLELGPVLSCPSFLSDSSPRTPSTGSFSPPLRTCPP